MYPVQWTTAVHPVFWLFFGSVFDGSFDKLSKKSFFFLRRGRGCSIIGGVRDRVEWGFCGAIAFAGGGRYPVT